MNVDSFLDTNVLVYAAMGRGEEESKRVCALKLIEEENFGLSVQVLQEFTSNRRSELLC
jgi:predicted nucleic acid-binding protein